MSHNPTIHEDTGNLDKSVLLRLPSDLLQAIDDAVKEKFPENWDRSKWMRRSFRYVLDNLDDFRKSKAAIVNEHDPIDSVVKINRVKTQWEEISKYADQVRRDPIAPMTEKRLTHFLQLIGQMIYLMED